MASTFRDNWLILICYYIMASSDLTDTSSHSSIPEAPVGRAVLKHLSSLAGRVINEFARFYGHLHLLHLTAEAAAADSWLRQDALARLWHCASAPGGPVPLYLFFVNVNDTVKIRV